MNRTGLRLSSLGVPILLAKGFRYVAPLTLMFATVLLRRKRIIPCLSLPKMVLKGIKCDLNFDIFSNDFHGKPLMCPYHI